MVHHREKGKRGPVKGALLSAATSAAAAAVAASCMLSMVCHWFCTCLGSGVCVMVTYHFIYTGMSNQSDE